MSKSEQTTAEWRTLHISSPEFSKRESAQTSMIGFGLQWRSFNYMWQAVIHQCEILNYREKQERERGTAALGMLKQEDGTADNCVFPHFSLMYCPLFAKTSETEISPGSKSSFFPIPHSENLISAPLKRIIIIFAHKNKPRKKDY